MRLFTSIENSPNHIDALAHIGDSLARRNTPAETNVAEWIRADAGAGASIESGSQVWNRNWADLIDEPKISSTDIKASLLQVTWPTSVVSL